eukprot:scaffold2136_cov242-Pinguiococcus_pyrenoidosus.AAC.6
MPESRGSTRRTATGREPSRARPSVSSATSRPPLEPLQAGRPRYSQSLLRIPGELDRGPLRWEEGRRRQSTQQLVPDGACDAALERMGRSQLGVAQLHWPPTLGWQLPEYLDGLSALKTSGKAKALGLSNFGPKTLKKVAQAMEARGTPISSNQVRASPCNRAFRCNGLRCSRQTRGCNAAVHTLGL